MSVTDKLEVDEYTKVHEVKSKLKRIKEIDEDQKLYENYYRKFFETIQEKYVEDDLEFDQDNTGLDGHVRNINKL